VYATSLRDTKEAARTTVIRGRTSEPVAYVHPTQAMDAEECEATERLRRLPRLHLDHEEGAPCHSCE